MLFPCPPPSSTTPLPTLAFFLTPDVVPTVDASLHCQATFLLLSRFLGFLLPLLLDLQDLSSFFFFAASSLASSQCAFSAARLRASQPSPLPSFVPFQLFFAARSAAFSLRSAIRTPMPTLPCQYSSRAHRDQSFLLHTTVSFHGSGQ